MNADQQMDALLTPYPEVNTDILEMYESFYYDDVDNSITFPKGTGAFAKGNTVSRLGASAKGNADVFDDLIEPRNLEAEFSSALYMPMHISDMIAEISSCYPTIGLKEIASKLNCVYCNSETMEQFVPGQRIGEYEYITQDTDFGVFLFGRKQSTDEYSTIQFWLK